MSKSEKSKQIQLRDDELSALAIVSIGFARIEESFDKIEEILNTRLERFVGIQECFQRAYMEVENTREEISDKLRKFIHPENEEEK